MQKINGYVGLQNLSPVTVLSQFQCIKNNIIIIKKSAPNIQLLIKDLGLVGLFMLHISRL